MARILYFASGAAPGAGKPTRGGDTRSLQLIRTLAADGHEVVVSWGLAGVAADALCHADRSQESIAATVRPDAVLFGSATAQREAWAPDVPTVVEVAGPTLIEDAFIAGASGGELVGRLLSDVASLAKADLVMCLGERQRWYLRPAMVLAGFDRSLPAPVAVVPPAVAADAIAPRDASPSVRVVLAGGIYPWTDPVPAVAAALDAIQASAAAEFHLVGGAALGPAADRRERDLLALMERFPRCVRHAVQPQEQLQQLLRTMSIALEHFEPNLERDLAVPYRTPLALASGLPVILHAASELADAIRSADAGWICRDAADVRAAVAEGIADPVGLARRSAAAQRLAAERFVDGAAAATLLAWLRQPTRRPRGAPATMPPSWTPAEQRLLLLLRHRALSWPRRAWSALTRR